MIKSPLVSKIVETERYSVEDMFSIKERIYTFLNPVSYLVALKDKELLSHFDGICADGSILVNAIRMVYGEKVSRRSFDMTSLAPQLFRCANTYKKSVCVVGTKQEMLELFVKKVSGDYHDIVWSGCRNGYFSSNEEMMESAKKIAKENPDFLIVGMGARKQEEFLLMCRNAGYHGIGFSCGGFIHQYAKDGHDAYYPDWIDRRDLRYLYRMYKEPYTRKRYLKAGILFPIKFLAERFSLL